MDRRLWGWVASLLLLVAGGWALVDAAPVLAAGDPLAAALVAGSVGLLAAGATAWRLPGRKAAPVGAGVGASLVGFAAPGMAPAAETIPDAFGLLRGLDPAGLTILLPAVAVAAQLVLAAGLGAWAAGRLRTLAPWLVGVSALALLAAPFASAAPGWAGVPAGLGLLAALPVLVVKASLPRHAENGAVPALRQGVVVALRPRGSARWLAVGAGGLVAPAVRVAGGAGSRFVVHRSREGQQDWLAFCADGAFVALESGAPGGPLRLRAARTDVAAACLFRFDGARLWSHGGRGHLVLRERRRAWWLPWRRAGAWDVGLADAPRDGSPFEVAVLADAPEPFLTPFADGARVTLRCRVEGRDRCVGIGADGRAAAAPLWEEPDVSRLVLRVSEEHAGAFVLETPSGEPLGLRSVGADRAFALAGKPEPLRVEAGGLRCVSGDRLALREDGSVVASEEGAHGLWLADETFLAFREVEVKEGERTLAGVSAFAAARAARLAARRKA